MDFVNVVMTNIADRRMWVHESKTKPITDPKQLQLLKKKMQDAASKVQPTLLNDEQAVADALYDIVCSSSLNFASGCAFTKERDSSVVPTTTVMVPSTQSALCAKCD